MDDENIKKSKEAVDLLMLQNKAREFQNKSNELQQKEYQGKFQGVSIKMKGDHTVFDVHIDQGFYETSSKALTEEAISTLMNNLNNAIKQEQDDLQRELQGDIERMQKDAMRKDAGNENHNRSHQFL